MKQKIIISLLRSILCKLDKYCSSDTPSNLLAYMDDNTLHIPSATMEDNTLMLANARMEGNTLIL